MRLYIQMFRENKPLKTCSHLMKFLRLFIIHPPSSFCLTSDHIPMRNNWATQFFTQKKNVTNHGII